MTGFTTEWLGLREPFDGAARNRTVHDAVVAQFAKYYSVTVSDLGSGTGSSFRAITSRLPVEQTWRLYDSDITLVAGPAAPTEGARFHRWVVNLAEDLELALESPLDLVTTSALLDLTSGGWAERLVTELAVRNLPFYAALTYDGRVALSPTDPTDTDVIMAVNHHQRTDKGFGAALGASAADFYMKAFHAVGYEVVSGQSDWVFRSSDQAMQLQMLEDWAGAARAVNLLPRWRVQDWLTRRRDLVATARSSMRVGHIDFFARPIATR